MCGFWLRRFAVILLPEHPVILLLLHAPPPVFLFPQALPQFIGKSVLMHPCWGMTFGVAGAENVSVRFELLVYPYLFCSAHGVRF